MSELEFNGPPPAHGNAANAGSIRVACQARPGEWANIVFEKESQARGRAHYYNSLPGFEATKRGLAVYVRFVGEPA